MRFPLMCPSWWRSVPAGIGWKRIDGPRPLARFDQRSTGLSASRCVETPTVAQDEKSRSPTDLDAVQTVLRTRLAGGNPDSESRLGSLRYSIYRAVSLRNAALSAVSPTASRRGGE